MADSDKDIWFYAGWLFTGDSETPHCDAALVHVKDSVIAEVILEKGEITRRRAELPHCLDFTDKYVTPGLINAHDHLEMNGVPGTMFERFDGPPIQVDLRTIANAVRSLARGITTIRDLGARSTYVLALRDAIARGEIRGPRILACGQMISKTGGHGQPISAEADGEEQIIRTVRQQVKHGADVIKLCASGGVVAGHAENPHGEEYSAREVASAIEEAHRSGRRITAHAHSAASIKTCASHGIDSIEHGAFIDDEAIDLLIAKEIALVPTLDDSFTVATYGSRLGRKPWVVHAAAKSLPSRVDGTTRAIARGVRIGVGTDVAGDLGREMARLVELGMSPVRALGAATSLNAAICGLETVTGKLVAGLSADLLILDRDPLTSLELIHDHVSSVMLAGEWQTPLTPDEAFPATPTRLDYVPTADVLTSAAGLATSHKGGR